MKKVIVSVTTDLVTDQRVHKVSQTLSQEGYEVLLVGRQLKNSLPLDRRIYSTKRFRLFFEKGALFYMSYSFRLFVFLLFTKTDVLLANDLDTLLPNYLVSKIKRIPLVYDNHEYFTGVPELQDRRFVRGLWKSIERFILPKLRYLYTVNDSIKKLYEEEYSVHMEVVRNIPYKGIRSEYKASIDIPANRKIIVYQGSGINIDRGVEELIEAMVYLNDVLLLVIGSGDVLPLIKDKVKDLAIVDKVIFIDKLPYDQLKSYTQLAHLGLTLDKDTNINYRYSLPNKLFDYIHAGIPVLSSRLIELEKVIDEYQVGAYIDSHDPFHIAERIRNVLEDEQKMSLWRVNTLKASEELCWEKEGEVVVRVFNKVVFLCFIVCYIYY